MVGTDTTGGDRFGISVAVDAGTILIGAPDADNGGGAQTGAGYVFVKTGNTWVQQAKLVGNDSAGSDFNSVGLRVALAGDMAFLAAPQHDLGDNFRGAVYVFKRTGTTWSQTQKLLASDAGDGTSFGNGLTAHNDTLLVGRPSGQGAIYVFKRSADTWTETSKLTATVAAFSTSIGGSLAFDGASVFTGIPTDTDSVSYQGSVLAFHHDGSTWTEQNKVQASDPSGNAFLGYGVAVRSGLGFIGAPRSGTVAESGALYVVGESGGQWEQLQKLQATVPASYDRFGAAVAVSDEVVVVGAPGKYFFPDPTPGAAHVFLRSGPTIGEQVRITGSDVVNQQQFGVAVAVEHCTVVVGALSANAAYVFE